MAITIPAPTGRACPIAISSALVKTQLTRCSNTWLQRCMLWNANLSDKAAQACESSICVFFFFLPFEQLESCMSSAMAVANFGLQSWKKLHRCRTWCCRTSNIRLSCPFGPSKKARPSPGHDHHYDAQAIADFESP